MGDNYDVTSHNQQGGITAGQVNLGKPLRKMEDNHKRELVEALADHAHKDVEIMASQGSEDCLQLARQYKEYLEGKGFKVGDVSPALILAAPNIINVDVKKPVIMIQVT